MSIRSALGFAVIVLIGLVSIGCSSGGAIVQKTDPATAFSARQTLRLQFQKSGQPKEELFSQVYAARLIQLLGERKLFKSVTLDPAVKTDMVVVYRLKEMNEPGTAMKLLSAANGGADTNLVMELWVKDPSGRSLASAEVEGSSIMKGRWRGGMMAAAINLSQANEKTIYACEVAAFETSEWFFANHELGKKAK